MLDRGALIDQEALNLYDAKINALIIATESGSFACVKCLVENGLDVNYRIDGKVRIHFYSSSIYLYNELNKLFIHLKRVKQLVVHLYFVPALKTILI